REPTRASLLQVACIGCIGCRWVRGVLMLAGSFGCEPACKWRVQATSSASPAGLWGRVAGAAALARVLAFLTVAAIVQCEVAETLKLTVRLALEATACAWTPPSAS